MKIHLSPPVTVDDFTKKEKRKKKTYLGDKQLNNTEVWFYQNM